MSSNIPSYLRLHDVTGEASVEQTDELQVLAQAAEAALGWRVTASQRREDVQNDAPLQISDTSDGTPLSSHAAATVLVDAINDLCVELRETRRALWQREAELAAAVPVTPRPDEEAHLAERLDAILQGGAEAVGADAAAMYLLDDDTSELKVRACWGLPKTRLLDPARPLRGAVADLEALVGHAVVLEDTSLLSHWKVPEEGFATAVCVPISSPTSPLGTLWLFSKEPRDFTSEQTNMVEIVAGRLASDLDREVLMHEGVNNQALQRQCDLVATSQYDRLPKMPPLLDGWQLSGWTIPQGDLLSDFYDWSVLPDGQLAGAVGAAMGRGLEAALTATNLHTALKAHAGYRHDARQMVARLNDTLWTSSAGDQFASLFYCLLDPDSGQLQFSSAGKAGAFLSTSSTSIAGNAVPLGTQPEDTFPFVRDHLPRGATLFLFSEGLLPLAEKSGRRRSTLAQLLDEAPHASAAELAEAARGMLLAKLDEPSHDATLLVIQRDK